MASTSSAVGEAARSCFAGEYHSISSVGYLSLLQREDKRLTWDDADAAVLGLTPTAWPAAYQPWAPGDTSAWMVMDADGPLHWILQPGSWLNPRIFTE